MMDSPDPLDAVSFIFLQHMIINNNSFISLTVFDDNIPIEFNR